MFFSIFVGAGAFVVAEGIVMMCFLFYLFDVVSWRKKHAVPEPAQG